MRGIKSQFAVFSNLTVCDVCVFTLRCSVKWNYLRCCGFVCDWVMQCSLIFLRYCGVQGPPCPPPSTVLSSRDDLFWNLIEVVLLTEIRSFVCNRFLRRHLRSSSTLESLFGCYDFITFFVLLGGIILLFINNIHKNLGSNLKLFADNAPLYRSTDTVNDCINLQNAFDKWVSWSNSWQMQFNVTKCHTMRITRKEEPA